MLIMCVHTYIYVQQENSLDESVRREVASEATFTQTFQLAKGLEDSSILVSRQRFNTQGNYCPKLLFY